MAKLTLQESDGSDRFKFLMRWNVSVLKMEGLSQYPGAGCSMSPHFKSVSDGENVESDNEESVSHFRLLILCWGEL